MSHGPRRGAGSLGPRGLRPAPRGALAATRRAYRADLAGGDRVAGHRGGIERRGRSRGSCFAATSPRSRPAGGRARRSRATPRRCAPTSRGSSAPGRCRRTRPRGSSPRCSGSRLPTLATREELDVLLDATLDASDPLAVRDRAIAELLYAAGLRVAELCGLDVDDVDLAARLVTVTGKGDKQRRVPIHEACAAAVAAWRAGAPRGDLDGATALPRRCSSTAAATGWGPATCAGSWRRAAAAPPPPRAAPHVRHAPLGGRGGPSRRPRAAGPREPHDDPGVHARLQGAPPAGAPLHAPAGVSRGVR